jgi:hypothetical protein
MRWPPFLLYVRGISVDDWSLEQQWYDKGLSSNPNSSNVVECLIV